MIAFDECQNGIPVVFVITSQCTEGNILPWLMNLRNWVLQYKPNWLPNAVIVDYAKVNLFPNA